jgi:hypothetical protein
MAEVPLDLEGVAPAVLFHNGHWNDWDKVIFNAGIRHRFPVPNGDWSDSRAMAWLAFYFSVNLLDIGLGKSNRICVFSPDEMRLIGDWKEDEGVMCSNLAWRRSFRQTGQGASNIHYYGQGNGDWRGTDDYWKDMVWDEKERRYVKNVRPTNTPVTNQSGQPVTGALPLGRENAVVMGGLLCWREADGHVVTEPADAAYGARGAAGESRFDGRGAAEAAAGTASCAVGIKATTVAEMEARAAVEATVEDGTENDSGEAEAVEAARLQHKAFVEEVEAHMVPPARQLRSGTGEAGVVTVPLREPSMEEVRKLREERKAAKKARKAERRAKREAWLSGSSVVHNATPARRFCE